MPKTQNAGRGPDRTGVKPENLHSPRHGRCHPHESVASPLDANLISHGTPDAYREAIFDAARMVAAQAEIVALYAELRNDAALEHGILCMIGYTRSAAATLADLKAMKDKGGVHDRSPQ